MYLIIGLGNIGAEYETTRHNLGFLAVEELAKKLGLAELKQKTKVHAFVGESIFEDKKLILAQPTTFMNNSGLAAQALLNWYKILPEHLIVIHDDVDLEVGQVRVRPSGGAGGHHGIESIIAHINSTEFNRIRIGIGRESLSGDVTEYVLGKTKPEERGILAAAIVKAADAVLAIISKGTAAAMNQFNA